MNTKNIIYLFCLVLLASCESFEDAADASDVKEICISIQVNSLVPGVESFDGFTVRFEDVKYGTVQSETISGENTAFTVVPGIYKIDVGGEFTDSSHDTYMLNGNKVNYPLVTDGEVVRITVNGLRQANLLFKEIYYAGSKTALNTNYFRDQFYELYNNSEDQVIYLDGIYFASLHPTSATTTLPVWPDEDGENYAYTDRVWKFPGTGTDYPLLPGESCVISQFAANHQLPQYNTNSPANGSLSEFEFNMNNSNFPDQPALDMVHVFYNGQAAMGSVPQYLTSVFGGAYVLFKPLQGDVYDPVGDPTLSTTNLASTSSKRYAKIPIAYVIDAVEAGHNESMLTAKRMPAALDKGMTWVGASYNSLGVARKKTGEHADGTPILQDTNDSTNDFDRGISPEFRRYCSKMPVWNHTLSGN